MKEDKKEAFNLGETTKDLFKAIKKWDDIDLKSFVLLIEECNNAEYFKPIRKSMVEVFYEGSLPYRKINGSDSTLITIFESPCYEIISIKNQTSKLNEYEFKVNLNNNSVSFYIEGLTMIKTTNFKYKDAFFGGVKLFDKKMKIDRVPEPDFY